MAFSIGEQGALVELRKSCSDKEPDTCYVIAQDDKFFLIDEFNIGLGFKVLPKHDCNQIRIKVKDEEEIQGVQVKINLLPKFVTSLLFTENKRVEIFRYQSPRYALSECGGPGNFEELVEYLDPESVDIPKPQVALHVDKSGTCFGLFVVHKTLRVVSLCSFEDNHEYDLLDSVLEGIAAGECVVPEVFKGQEKVVKILAKQNILSVPTNRKTSSKLEDVTKELQLKVMDPESHDWSKIIKDESNAIIASHLLVPDLPESSFELKILNPCDFMRLSSATLDGLHIFGKTSLFSVMNHTRTNGGERLLRAWLRQPLTDREKIQNRLDIVESFVNGTMCRKFLSENALRKIPDFAKICQKFDFSKANLQDLYKIYLGVRESTNIVKSLKEEFGEDEENCVVKQLVRPIHEILCHFRKFVELVEKTLDFEAIDSEGSFRVKPSFDETLTELDGILADIKSKVEAVNKREMGRLNMTPKTLKLECNAIHGYFFRVTLKEEKGLRQKKDLIFFDSSKNGVKFRTSELERLNDKYTETCKKYDCQQQHIIEEVIECSKSYCQYLLTLSSKLSELDCFVSMATASESAPSSYVKPQINDDGIIDLKKARHPILEQKSSVNFIPNDAFLDNNSKNFVIITGPNLGGKSTYMRSVALNVFLAQIGSFVACQEANISIVDNILVRIGASDSQFYGNSTFMVEMLDASRILRHATPKSLILIDEIGRGTSTYDGFGLAWAISKHIATQIKAATLFATHFHEMTELANEEDNVTNVYCDAIVDDGQLTLLYTIGPGICKNSFGIEVAQMAGLPEDVLANARTALAEMEQAYGEMDGDKRKLSGVDDSKSPRKKSKIES